MSTRIKTFTLFSLIAFMLSLSTMADAQIRAYRVTDRQVQTVLNRIEMRTDAFRTAVDRSLDRSGIDGTNQEDSINTMIANFEAATDRLKNNFASRRSTAADVEDVLNRAVAVDGFMRNNRLGANAESEWRLIRADLNTLAGYYSVRANWDNTTPVPIARNPYYVSDGQLQGLLNRIENRTNAFQREVERTLDRSVIDGTSREESITALIANFETATDRLANNFASRRSTAADVQEVLNRAVGVNNFVARNRLSVPAENHWAAIRTDLNTLAGYYRVAVNWDVPGAGTSDGYVASDAQMRALLNRMSLRTTSFRRSFEAWERANRQAGTASGLTDDVRQLERNVQDLRLDFDESQPTDVQEILRPSATINSFIAANRTNTDVNNRWNLLKTDITTLANYYRISWNWDTTPVDTTAFDSRITGTYRLNTALSDNLNAVIERTLISANYDDMQRDRVRRNLERRLASPAVLAIEKRGREVVLSSANGSQVTLIADGVGRTETSPNGRTVRTSVTATDRDVVINYEGDRINDYYVTFAPVANGQLRVTRRVYLENQNETVTVTSVYDKTSPSPDWNMTAGVPAVGTGTVEGFIIPNNTGLIARLNTPLSTRTAKDRDRFSMTVTSPSQYEGAVIEGSVVGEKSGMIAGRAHLSLSFDTIRLRTGQVYRFAGIVDQVREPDGSIVSVNNEGEIRDRSQTNRTIQRAGIGAVLGAIIGAIAGGGQGAAIGAGVGAGAGAGTVILQGRDNLELESGTTFTITATAPANVVNR